MLAGADVATLSPSASGSLAANSAVIVVPTVAALTSVRSDAGGAASSMTLVSLINSGAAKSSPAAVR